MAEAEGTGKDKIALGLGIAAMFLPCIPCVGSPLYMMALVGAMVTGFMHHTEAKETGADTTLAKAGMGIATIPLVLGVLFFVLYILFAVVMVVLSSM